MGRYTGPRTKISRRFGEPVFGPDKVLDRRQNPPGQHGVNKRRKKMSEYGVQLREKQKAKAIYGMREKQFRLFFERARAKQGVTGDIMLALCECRLDNIVYRLGLSPTRAGARQLVNHGHILVNGKKVDIPSYLCKVNDVISIKGDSPLKVVKEAMESKPSTCGYVKVDDTKFEGTFVREPERNELPQEINESQIIEYYNRKL